MQCGIWKANSRLFIVLLLLSQTSQLYGDTGDLNIDGTFEAALDLPRILFLLKRNPNQPPLEYEGNFELNWAFLDTGASGILLSHETTTYLNIAIDPDAQYSDVGVGGREFFDVSEPLYVGTTDFLNPDPYNPDLYLLTGPWRLQVKQYNAGPYPDEPIDLLGMPVMAGKVVVLDAGGPNQLAYFAADIKDPNDTQIPAVDFKVALRFDRYVTPEDPNNIPPLPVLAYNPVIDNITVEYNGMCSTGTWLLDTGATISLISISQAAAIGLVDANGQPLGSPDFVVPIGGIGGTVNIPGFEIDNLIVPTLNGYNLVFNHARIGVHDIGIFDTTAGRYIILDGVFGSNFLCASAKLEFGFPVDLAAGAFKTIVIDAEEGLLGFDVNDVYPLPSCGDTEHPRPRGDVTGDCTVDARDLETLLDNLFRNDCTKDNAYCNHTDLDENGYVNLIDYAAMARQWLNSPFSSICGDVAHPWPPLDLNRDCVVDLHDLQILADEWLNGCSVLNWNCRGADLTGDRTVNLRDLAESCAVK